MQLADWLLKNRLSKRLRQGLPESAQDFLVARFAPSHSRRSYRAAMRGRKANIATILNRLKNSCQEVSAPLVLISQIQRSGGSLLSQLFDGHSEILAHPHELKLGYPSKENWPPISPDFSTDKQFEILFEISTIRMCEEGYAKGKKDTDRRHFFFIPQVQRDLFRYICEKRGRPNSRSVLDSYFTSYFNSWLNLRANIARARYVTGFTPLLVNETANMEQYWSAYPDGFLISIVRSPLSWYPSAMRLLGGKKYSDVQWAAHCWCRSTEAILREKERHGDRVIVLHFDDLVENTESTLRLVCGRLGLAFEPVLLQPTFNGEAMSANTSFDRLEPGQVSDAPTKRHMHLSPTQRTYIEKQCLPLYRESLRAIDPLPNVNRAAE